MDDGQGHEWKQETSGPLSPRLGQQVSRNVRASTRIDQCKSAKQAPSIVMVDMDTGCCGRVRVGPQLEPDSRDAASSGTIASC
jgi:hypothetical protein